MALSHLSAAELRWTPDPASLDRGDAAAGNPWPALEHELRLRLTGMLRPGASTRRQLFIQHAPGIDAQQLLRQSLDSIEAAPGTEEDFCFVHNFNRPERPRLLRLPPGGARILHTELRQIARFIRDELEGALESRPIRNRLLAIDERTDAELRRVTAELEKRLKPHGLVLVREQVGQLVRLTVHVQQTGRVITQDDLANLVARGQVSLEEFESIREVVREIQPELQAVTERANAVWKKSRALVRRLLQVESRRLLSDLAHPLREALDEPEVIHHLDCVIADVLDNRVGQPVTGLPDPEAVYAANIVHISVDDRLPVVWEHHPTARNLGCSIDPEWHASGTVAFRGIRAGSLVEAHGGFLVLEAAALLARPDSVALLTRTLANARLTLEQQESGPALRPDPIPLDLRLIVLGSANEWHRLREQHPVFCELFQPPLELPDSIERTPDAVAWMAGELRQIADRLRVPTPEPRALAALIEHAARLGGPGRLSLRMSRLGDLLRDAAVLAQSADEDEIGPARIHEAARRRRLPTGDPVAAPAGRQPRVGQCRSIAADAQAADTPSALVIHAGVAPASDFGLAITGAVVTRPVNLAQQLQAWLGELLHLERPPRVLVHLYVESWPAPDRAPGPPLPVAATLAAVLSRLADTPLRQDRMLTGDLDPHGRLIPDARIEDRIEQAHAAMRASSQSGGGIIIPAAHRGAMMVDTEVVHAAEHGLFEVHAATSIAQALELLTGQSPGIWRENDFPPDSLFARARRRLQTGAD
ncbi:MAG: ATP-binding protein [Wenzhouxiangellaceae bacterium]